jgi:hypothetical protein
MNDNDIENMKKRIAHIKDVLDNFNIIEFAKENNLSFSDLQKVSVLMTMIDQLFRKDFSEEDYQAMYILFSILDEVMHGRYDTIIDLKEKLKEQKEIDQKFEQYAGYISLFRNYDNEKLISVLQKLTGNEIIRKIYHDLFENPV